MPVKGGVPAARSKALSAATVNESAGDSMGCLLGEFFDERGVFAKLRVIRAAEDAVENRFRGKDVTAPCGQVAKDIPCIVGTSCTDAVRQERHLHSTRKSAERRLKDTNRSLDSSENQMSRAAALTFSFEFGSAKSGE